jgi:hypothetical protein
MNKITPPSVCEIDKFNTEKRNLLPVVKGMYGTRLAGTVDPQLVCDNGIWNVSVRFGTPITPDARFVPLRLESNYPYSSGSVALVGFLDDGLWTLQRLDGTVDLKNPACPVSMGQDRMLHATWVLSGINQAIETATS